MLLKKGLEIWACEWEDAHWDSGEYESHELTHKPVVYVTVGILLKDDATGVSLAADICETGSFRGINFIPKKMLLRQWKVGALHFPGVKKPRTPRLRTTVREVLDPQIAP